MVDIDNKEKLYCIVVNDNGTQVQYYFKGVQSAVLQRSATMTEYPTVEGTNFSDHKYRNLENVTITFLVNGLVSTNIYSIIDNTKTNLSKDEVKNLFFNWYENSVFLTIQTRETELKNYQVTDISYTEDDNTLGSWQPTVVFSEARVATIETQTFHYAQTSQDGASNNESKNGGQNNGNGSQLVDISDTPQDGASPTLGTVIGGAIAGGGAVLVGVKVGAAIGSIFPGAGTVIGGVLGGIVGGAAALFGWFS